ncbi:hypothetical protein E3N88_13972 [Mikania micrantha]|uniref:E3 ubiquitin-protein ligase RMA n=1 Tax=Mikania micrantha TaxID=192012 RepID=A0A5N6P0G8_9ASTR|nr:hypothetical protein E3N88_13972 [Mikania micrantha]
MGDHRADDLFMHVDLNQEPLVGPSSPSLPMASPPGFGFVSGKHVTPRRAIEDRFMVLEAVSASARKPQIRRRIISNPALTYMSEIDPIVGANCSNCERLKNHEGDTSHLAKALGLDLDGKDNDDDHKSVDGDRIDGGVFDCYICFCLAKGPILTCCGHLFCWRCFYQVPYVD